MPCNTSIDSHVCISYCAIPSITPRDMVTAIVPLVVLFILITTSLFCTMILKNIQGNPTPWRDGWIRKPTLDQAFLRDRLGFKRLTRSHESSIGSSPPHRQRFSVLWTQHSIGIHQSCSFQKLALVAHMINHILCHIERGVMIKLQEVRMYNCLFLVTRCSTVNASNHWLPPLDMDPLKSPLACSIASRPHVTVAHNHQ